MLTIQAEIRDNRTLHFMVIDEDGETAYEASAVATLEAIADADGIATGAKLARDRAFQSCTDYCDDRAYWVSPNVKECIARSESIMLESMRRS